MQTNLEAVYSLKRRESSDLDPEHGQNYERRLTGPQELPHLASSDHQSTKNLIELGTTSAKKISVDGEQGGRGDLPVSMSW